MFWHEFVPVAVLAIMAVEVLTIIFEGRVN
jgi:hypothetical protein